MGGAGAGARYGVTPRPALATGRLGDRRSLRGDWATGAGQGVAGCPNPFLMSANRMWEYPDSARRSASEARGASSPMKWCPLPPVRALLGELGQLCLGPVQIVVQLPVLLRRPEGL